MRKRLLLALSIIITCVTAVQAQLAVGSWKIYPTFATVDKILDTKSTVYYLTNGQLYSREKNNDETCNMSTDGLLNDNNIQNIYHDIDNNLTAVVYANANIDIIDRNGDVHNMPDIMDATLDVVPVINDVDFDGNRMYAATNFGVVAFDTDRMEVVTAGNYGKNMTSVAVIGDYVWLVEGYIYYTVDKNKSMTSVSSLKKDDFGYTTKEFMPLGDSKGVVFADDYSCLLVIDFEPGNCKIATSLKISNLKNLQRLGDGRLMWHNNNAIYTADADGKITTTSIAGTELESTKVSNVWSTKNIASSKGLDELWLGDDNGVSSYSIKGGELTVLSQAARPDNALTFSSVGRITVGKSGAVYPQTYGLSVIKKSEFNHANSHYLFHVNKIENGVITDITPTVYDTKNKNHKPYSTSPVGFKSGYMMLENPNDAESYLVGSAWDGIYGFKNREQTCHYYDDNSTMHSSLNGYTLRSDGFDFDSKGNLWAAQLVNGGTEKQFHMLPADKVGKETTVSDWQALDIPTIDESGHDGKILACDKSNVVVYIDGSYQGSVHVIKTKGTATLSDDQYIASTELVDQDGLVHSYNYTYSVIEDHDGHVWLGTDNGIVEITNPADVTSTTFKVNHLKVPRRDGTNFADYLLDGEIIYDMAVDPSNRKWIATARSGVYLVSAEGDRIIEHFDPTNSPLSSYTVLAVACGPSNDVYFGTNTGLLQYNATAAPAQPDYSNVYAYPNPVRPDYSGWITVTGLMDNSLVKITDAAGNVVHQGMSQGGMFVWDGCSQSGQRVKTGVYYVLASCGGDGEQSQAAVTKIMVVN